MRALARIAALIYYRVEYRGGKVPPHGPVLIVANHPNSLLDPMLVAAAAGRPVRFLAKAPLFDDPKVAWLMRLSRSIPVHRRQDNPSLVARNTEMFRAVHAALVDGAAVAIFPEGISHSAPSLAEIKTGAARIALGAELAGAVGLQIIPVGIDLRDKARFRSHARVHIGSPVDWQDLFGRGADDSDAVSTLTERIEAALRAITVNLDAWHDAPIVEAAIDIWEAADPARGDPETRVERRDITTRILARVRAEAEAEATDLIGDVERHHRRLMRLGLEPADLQPGAGPVGTLSRLLLWLPLALIVGGIGWLAWLVPYRLTGWLVDRIRLEPDTRATWKLMLGAVVYAAWLVLVAVVVGLVLDWRDALLVALLLPVVGMIGLLVREEWREGWRDAGRWLLLRSRPELIESLREEQQRLAAELETVRRET